MSGEAFPVAGQIEGGSVLPVRAEDRGNAPAGTTRPAVECEDLVALYVPGTPGRRHLRIARAVEPELVFHAVLRENRDEREGPAHLDEPPPAFGLAETERGFRHVRLEGPLIWPSH